MIWNLLFWLGLAISLGIGAIYFRDLGDVSQMVLKVKRRDMIRFIRNEYKFIGAGLAAAFVMAAAHLGFEAGPIWLFWTALALADIPYELQGISKSVSTRRGIPESTLFKPVSAPVGHDNRPGVYDWHRPAAPGREARHGQHEPLR